MIDIEGEASDLIDFKSSSIISFHSQYLIIGIYLKTSLDKNAELTPILKKSYIYLACFY